MAWPDPPAPAAPGDVPAGLFVGLVTLDLVQRVDKAPGPNEKVVAFAADIAAGGPATNAAVTFAALGGRATLVTSRGPVPCSPSCPTTCPAMASLLSIQQRRAILDQPSPRSS